MFHRLTQPAPCLAFAALLWFTGCETTATHEAEHQSPAMALLDRSIEHHDPDGVWGRESIPVHWTGTKPDGSTSFEVDMVFAANGDFSMRGERRGHSIDYRVDEGLVTASVDGEPEVSEELQSLMVLDRDEGLFWRDYLGFLGGMPMGLRVPDVQFEPEVIQTDLDGRAVQAIRAGFAPEIGTDTWTFYFDPATSALVGCRFDRADPTRDGETILFEGVSSVAGMRLPHRRRWYMNEDRRFLGTDELTASTGE